jgi:hypothetical protein
MKSSLFKKLMAIIGKHCRNIIKELMFWIIVNDKAKNHIDIYPNLGGNFVILG